MAYAALASIPAAGLALGIHLAMTNQPRFATHTSNAERQATTAIFSTQTQQTIEEGLEPFRTRDFRWVIEKYGHDPGEHGMYDKFNKQYWEKNGVILHNGTWVSETPPETKPPGELWIGTFGASSVEGGFGFTKKGKPDWNSWPYSLEELLRSEGYKIRVFNYGISGTETQQARWRLENEAIPTGIDIALVYTGLNNSSQCISQFDEPTRDSIREYERTGNEQILKELHPWFYQHITGWKEIRQQTNSELNSRLSSAEDSLRIALEDTKTMDQDRLKKKLSGDNHFERLPPVVLNNIDEVRTHLARGESLYDWATSDPQIYRDALIGAEALRRREYGDEILRNPHIFEELNSHGLDPSVVQTHMFHTLGTVPELAEESRTIRELEGIIESTKGNNIELGILAVPAGYRERTPERGACIDYALTGTAVQAYIEGGLNPWQQQLAQREGIPYRDIQKPLLESGDSELFNDVVHLTYKGKNLAIAESIAPLTRELIRRKISKTIPHP